MIRVSLDFPGILALPLSFLPLLFFESGRWSVGGEKIDTFRRPYFIFSGM